MDGITQGHDLAVLTLKTYVELECYLTINPICYPYAPKPSVIGKTAFIIGFGLKKLGTPTTRLQKANVQITTERCDEWNLRGNQLCALGNPIGNQRLADTCSGDSGGGLIISDDTTDRYFLVGITSFGEEDCGHTGIHLTRLK
ncbi:transmembrane protease serine 12 [Eurytemora carolleeae]|uniref:transmembrane protease serine 12 n=1 Tax=Eurytemora carolleeae TaxID=1294199 RepID=UPI000C7878D7|nr:transmembrane protease serine 12 [Eurytemora carolleeae]|eukprot:XP_023341890.1 transmembrane protease serine 12-like [Eurytemora affinis]